MHGLQNIEKPIAQKKRVQHYARKQGLPASWGTIAGYVELHDDNDNKYQNPRNMPTETKVTTQQSIITNELHKILHLFRNSKFPQPNIISSCNSETGVMKKPIMVGRFRRKLPIKSRIPNQIIHARTKMRNRSPKHTKLPISRIRSATKRWTCITVTKLRHHLDKHNIHAPFIKPFGDILPIANQPDVLILKLMKAFKNRLPDVWNWRRNNRITQSITPQVLSLQNRSQ